MLSPKQKPGRHARSTLLKVWPGQATVASLPSAVRHDAPAAYRGCARLQHQRYPQPHSHAPSEQKKPLRIVWQ